MKVRIVVLLSCIISMMSLCRVVSAQTFSSAVLEKTAQQLKLSRLDTLPQGYSVVQWQNVRLSFVKHGKRIDHIGRQLFSPVFRLQDPLPAYDYLEFAFLEQSVLRSDNLFKYNNVSFAAGSWSDLREVSEKTPCSVSITDGRHYEVRWDCGAQKQVVVQFPVNYDIISTATRSELEACLLYDLSHHSRTTAKPIDNASLEASLQQATDLIYFCPGERYLQPTINNDTYYYKTAKGDYMLVSDPNNPLEALANSVCSPAADWHNWLMDITFNLHNDQRQTQVVALTLFADFCRSQGCTLYWGAEEYNADKVTGTIIANNPVAGYNHVIKLEYQRRQKGRTQRVKAKASLYVPISNVRNLYKQYDPKDKKNKIKLNIS